MIACNEKNHRWCKVCRPDLAKKVSDNMKIKYSQGWSKDRSKESYKHTEESKAKISAAFKKKRQDKLETYFVISKKRVSAQRLKAKLIEFELKKDECEICFLPPVWNGKKLVLQVDHINGINTDNRIFNLMIICPNCHSQSLTFSGLNKNSLRSSNK